MKRSSWIVLLLAGALLLAATYMYRLSYSARAPSMTREDGLALVDKGRQAMETSDAPSLMSLFSSDAKILGRDREDFHALINKTFEGLKGHFRLSIRNVEVQPGSESAEITFIMDLGQSDERMDAIYHPDVRVRAKLRKVRVPRWLGLYEAEEWKVSELTSDPEIVPKPTQT